MLESSFLFQKRNPSCWRVVAIRRLPQGMKPINQQSGKRMVRFKPAYNPVNPKARTKSKTGASLLTVTLLQRKTPTQEINSATPVAPGNSQTFRWITDRA